MNILHDTFLGVIKNSSYNLNDILNKIEKAWILNKLNDTEYTELVTLAQSNAKPEDNRATLQEQINALVEDIKAIRAELQALSKEQPEEEEVTTYPEWVAWNGIGTVPYQKGTRCLYNGKVWESQVDNNIWQPSALGVNETIWKEIKE